MEFIINTVLPISLFIGFISYMLKCYYHFLYLKIIKKYLKGMSFFNFLGSINRYLIDRFEIILPFIFIRKNVKLTIDERKKVNYLRKRIILFLLIFIFSFVFVMPLGIYLQNNFI